MQSLQGQWSEKGNSDLDTSSSLHSGMPMLRPNRAPYFQARVWTLACTWGSWKDEPPSPHDPISQHPTSSTGTSPVKGGPWDNTVNLVFQSGGFLRAGSTLPPLPSCSGIPTLTKREETYLGNTC